MPWTCMWTWVKLSVTSTPQKSQSQYGSMMSQPSGWCFNAKRWAGRVSCLLYCWCKEECSLFQCGGGAKGKNRFYPTIKLMIKYQLGFSFNMTRYLVWLAFGGKVLAVLGINGHNFISVMQTYTAKHFNSVNVCLQQGSSRAKKIPESLKLS